MEKKYVFNVCEDFEDERLDVFLSKTINEKSRANIQKLIKEKNVFVNQEIKKCKYKLKYGDLIEINIPNPIELDVKPQDIKLDILYEDKDVIVVNKPQGMTVHPAPNVYTDTLVNALLYHCNDLSGINGVLRPGIVHRIDKNTSGILVVAKNDYAHNKLAEQLKDHSMTREYIALTEGVIKDDVGLVDEPVGRHPKDRIKMAVIKDGKRAVTHYEVKERFKNNTLIVCRLETGRTHQIRVHMAYIGHPLVGDPVYGYKKQKFNLNGQVLHARKLGFIHPTTNEYMEFCVEPPKYFLELINKLQNSNK